MRRLALLLLAASTLAGCAPAVAPQQPAVQGPVARCGDEEIVAPEFDVIRSKVNLSATGVQLPSYMLANTERPTPDERIEIARWSQIRDTCFRQSLVSMSVPVPGIPQPLQQQMVEIFRQAGESQHALVMTLARGDMPYGLFVQESTQIAVRMTSAIQPFIQETGVLEQVAVLQSPNDVVQQISADQNARAVGVTFNDVLGAFAEALVDAADDGAFDSLYYHGGHGGHRATGHFYRHH